MKKYKRPDWTVFSVPEKERLGDGCSWFVAYWPSRWGGPRRVRECKSMEQAFLLAKKYNAEGRKPVGRKRRK